MDLTWREIVLICLIYGERGRTRDEVLEQAQQLWSTLASPPEPTSPSPPESLA